MNESFTKKTTSKNTKDVIQQASVSSYHFGRHERKFKTTDHRFPDGRKKMYSLE